MTVRDMRDEKGRILPGSTLTGAGRQKGAERMLRELLRDDWVPMAKVIRDIAMGRMPEGATYGLEIKPRDRIEAWKALNDRAWGKPKVIVDLVAEVEHGLGSVATESLSDDALAILRDAIAGQLEPKRRVIDAKVVERAEQAAEQGIPNMSTPVPISGTESSAPGVITTEPPVSSEIVARPAVETTPPEPAREVIRHVFRGSANVQSATLDVASGVVEVVFTSGARFRYANFTKELLAKWGLAVSAGKWFNVEVRGNPDKHPPVRR